MFDDALSQHVTLLLGTLLPGLLIGLPVGVWLWRYPRWQSPVFAVLNVIQTVPSVALFGLLIAPLAGLARQFPSLAQLGVSGTGITPALIALVLYALLPLVRGVTIGLQQVPREALESATAMGMSGGLLSSALDLVLLGVIPTIALAVVVDALFALWGALLKGEARD